MYFHVLCVFKIDVKLSSVDSIQSVLHSFTLVDSGMSVLDFCYLYLLYALNNLKLTFT